MTDDKKELIRPTEADGIQEFDNKLPRWWVWLFYLTTIAGVIYGVKLHFFGGETLIQTYDLEVSEHLAKLNAPIASATPGTPEETASEESLSTRLASDTYIKAGKETFDTMCSPCHGPDGGGVIGPNLTDNYFLHGRTPEEVVKVISEGVPEKGMVAWKPVLGPLKVEQAAAYVMSLRGKTPVTAKAPEGQLIE